MYSSCNSFRLSFTESKMCYEHILSAFEATFQACCIHLAAQPLLVDYTMLLRFRVVTAPEDRADVLRLREVQLHARLGVSNP